MIKYGILVGGIAFYFFVISHLLTVIRDENFSKSFIRLMDSNNDGIITSKEIKAFTPCEKYEGKKISKAFREFGRRVDINDFAQDLSPKMVLKSIEGCVGDVESLSHDKNIQKIPKGETASTFLEAYDINNDGNIRFSEYHISNQFLHKTPKNLRSIFKYFDHNHDWVISTKELNKSKPKNIHTYLASGKRK